MEALLLVGVSFVESNNIQTACRMQASDYYCVRACGCVTP